MMKKNDTKSKIPNPEVNNLWAESFHILMQLGLTMVGCIGLCLYIGKYLDELFGTKGIFVIIFILFGVFGGANVVYRQIISVTDPQKRGSSHHGDN